MVLGLASSRANKKGKGTDSLHLDYRLHIVEINPWHSPSTKAESVLVHWRRGIKHSGKSRKGTFQPSNEEGGGKMVFNDSFKLPITLYREPEKAEGSLEFREKILTFRLFQAKGLIQRHALAQISLNLAQYAALQAPALIQFPIFISYNTRPKTPRPNPNPSPPNGTELGGYPATLVLHLGPFQTHSQARYLDDFVSSSLPCTRISNARSSSSDKDSEFVQNSNSFESKPLVSNGSLSQNQTKYDIKPVPISTTSSLFQSKSLVYNGSLPQSQAKKDAWSAPISSASNSFKLKPLDNGSLSESQDKEQTAAVNINERLEFSGIKAATASLQAYNDGGLERPIHAYRGPTEAYKGPIETYTGPKQANTAPIHLPLAPGSPEPDFFFSPRSSGIKSPVLAPKKPYLAASSMASSSYSSYDSSCSDCTRSFKEDTHSINSPEVNIGFGKQEETIQRESLDADSHLQVFRWRELVETDHDTIISVVLKTEKMKPIDDHSGLLRNLEVTDMELNKKLPKSNSVSKDGKERESEKLSLKCGEREGSMEKALGETWEQACVAEDLLRNLEVTDTQLSQKSPQSSSVLKDGNKWVLENPSSKCSKREGSIEKKAVEEAWEQACIAEGKISEAEIKCEKLEWRVEALKEQIRVVATYERKGLEATNKKVMVVERKVAEANAKAAMVEARANREVALAEERATIAEGNAKLLELKLEITRGEVVDSVATEAAIYSAVAEHGSSFHKVHSPAQRLARLYCFASKMWSKERQARSVRSSVSGLITVVRACGNDIPRLTYWWSNVVVLREMISQPFDEADPFFLGVSKDTLVERQKLMSGESVNEWERERSMFVAALDRLESWIHAKVAESVWWQALSSPMENFSGEKSHHNASGEYKTNTRASYLKVLGPELGDGREENQFLDIWKRAFADAFERLCPIRSAGIDCGCLPFLATLVLESCVSRLDVAMLNAILQSPNDEVPTDSVSDPIGNLNTLPIPTGNLSFGAAAQLKNVAGTLSAWITNLISNVHDNFENNRKVQNEVRCLSFSLLRATGDLLMLPKDMLMDRAMRKEVCPELDSTLIRRILLKFVPDEFSPDPISPSILAAISNEILMEEEKDENVCAPRIAYSPPLTSKAVREWMGNQLRLATTTDDEMLLHEVEYPVSWLIENCPVSTTSERNNLIMEFFSPERKEKVNSNGPLELSKSGVERCEGFNFLRQVWIGNGM